MSTEPTRGANNKPTHVSDESESKITVTDHARLRYLQRVDAACPNPDQQLRQMFRTGSTARAHPDVDHGRARRAGDTIIAYRGSESSPTIVTVLADRTGGQR